MKIDAQFKGPQTAADVKIGQVVIAHTQRTQECFAMRLIESSPVPADPIPFAVVGCRVGPDEPGYFSDGHVLFLNADYPVTVFDVVSPLRLVERAKASPADAPEAVVQRPISLCACERCVGLRMSIKAAGVNPGGNAHVARHHANCGCMVCEVKRINASFESTAGEEPAAGEKPTLKPEPELPRAKPRCNCILCSITRLLETGVPI